MRKKRKAYYKIGDRLYKDTGDHYEGLAELNSAYRPVIKKEGPEQADKRKAWGWILVYITVLSIFAFPLAVSMTTPQLGYWMALGKAILIINAGLMLVLISCALLYIIVSLCQGESFKEMFS